MDFLFLPLPPDERAGAAGELMSSASKTIKSTQLIGDGTAANDDQLGEGRKLESKAVETSGAGWDSYEVWRRYIKDARDRRKPSESN
jgi:hypothetical protein